MRMGVYDASSDAQGLSLDKKGTLHTFGIGCVGGFPEVKDEQTGGGYSQSRQDHFVHLPESPLATGVATEPRGDSIRWLYS